MSRKDIATMSEKLERTIDLPAILGGQPVRPVGPGETLPHPGEVGNREVTAGKEVILSNRWSGGSWHDRAKEVLARITGAKHVSLCTNGTHALYLANATFGVQAWTRVMVPALTWQATAGNVLTLAGVPVIVDVDPSTLTMSLDAARAELERRLAAHEAMPRVVWVVALYHRLPNLRAFRELVDEFTERSGHKIHLGLDFAHGPGGRFEGRSPLDFVDVMVGSGQESKNAKGGEAGWIATNDPAFRAEIESRISCGREVEGMTEPVQSDQFRLPALVAGPYAVQLERYERDWLPVLQRNARRIDAALRGVPGIEPLADVPGAESQVYKLAFRVTPEFHLRAPQLLAALEAEIGHEVRGPYPSLTLADNRNPYRPGKAPTAAISPEYRRLITTMPDVPVAVRALDEIVCVEWAFLLREDCVEVLVRALRKIGRHAAEISRAIDAGTAQYSIDW